MFENKPVRSLRTCIFVPTALTGHYICSEMKTEAFFHILEPNAFMYAQILSSLMAEGDFSQN